MYTENTNHVESESQAFSWMPNIEYLRKLHLQAALNCEEIPEVTCYPNVTVSKINPFSLFDQLGMMMNHHPPQKTKFTSFEQYSNSTENSAGNSPQHHPAQFRGYYSTSPLKSEGLDSKRKLQGCSRLKNSDVLETWFYTHEDHPYPTKEEKEKLARDANLTLNQVSNFFINFRRRYRKENGLERKKKSKFLHK